MTRWPGSVSWARTSVPLLLLSVSFRVLVVLVELRVLVLQGFRTQAQVQQEAEEAAREKLMGGTDGGGAAGGAAGGEPQIHQTLPDSTRLYLMLLRATDKPHRCGRVCRRRRGDGRGGRGSGPDPRQPRAAW